MSAPRADRKDDKNRVAPQRDRSAVRHWQEIFVDRLHQVGRAARELESRHPKRPEAGRPKCNENECCEHPQVDKQKPGFNARVADVQRRKGGPRCKRRD